MGKYWWNLLRIFCKILAEFWQNSDKILAEPWQNFGRVLADFLQILVTILEKPWLNLDLAECLVMHVIFVQGACLNISSILIDPAGNLTIKGILLCTRRTIVCLRKESLSSSSGCGAAPCPAAATDQEHFRSRSGLLSASNMQMCCKRLTDSAEICRTSIILLQLVVDKR